MSWQCDLWFAKHILALSDEFQRVGGTIVGLVSVALAVTKNFVDEILAPLLRFTDIPE